MSTVGPKNRLPQGAQAPARPATPSAPEAATPVVTQAPASPPVLPAKPGPVQDGVSTAGPHRLIAPRMEPAPNTLGAKLNTELSQNVNAGRVMSQVQSNQMNASTGATQATTADPAKALEGKSRADKLRTLDGMNEAQFKTMVEGVRSGAVKDPESVMAVNVAQLGRTRWGRKNGDEVEALRSAFVDGKVTYSPAPAGEGGAKAWAFTKDGTSKVHQDLMRHPEAAAATLANEAVSLAIEKKGKPFPPYLEEETRSTVAEATVWGELKKNAKDLSHPAVKETQGNHDVYAARGEAGVRAETAAVYAKGMSINSRWDSVANMVDELAKHKDSQQKMTADNGKKLGEAMSMVALKRGEAAAKGADKPEEARGDAVSTEMGRLARALKSAPADAVDAAYAAVKATLGQQAADDFKVNLDMVRKQKG